MTKLINLPFNLSEFNHELRIPMAGALGALDLLNDESLDPKERDELIEIARQSTERLWATLNRILNSSVKEIKNHRYKLFASENEHRVTLVINENSNTLKN